MKLCTCWNVLTDIKVQVESEKVVFTITFHFYILSWKLVPYKDIKTH